MLLLPLFSRQTERNRFFVRLYAKQFDRKDISVFQTLAKCLCSLLLLGTISSILLIVPYFQVRHFYWLWVQMTYGACITNDAYHIDASGLASFGDSILFIKFWFDAFHFFVRCTRVKPLLTTVVSIDCKFRRLLSLLS